jgi:hypothetical protein
LAEQCGGGADSSHSIAQETSAKHNDHYVGNFEDARQDSKPESLEFRWLVGLTGILEEAEGREGGRHLLTITCSQAAGIAKGRPFEKLVRSGIFDRANRGQEILAWRSGIRGGFAPKK